MTTDIAVYALAAMLVLSAGCTVTEPPPTELIHADAEDAWCRAKVDGVPVLKPKVHAEVCQ